MKVLLTLYGGESTWEEDPEAIAAATRWDRIAALYGHLAAPPSARSLERRLAETRA